jgi:tetratricopeptide (TPR) repeat protein
LSEFPIQGLIRTEIALAEAYAAGGYHKQADEHLAQAREVSDGAVHYDSHSQRLQVDFLLAEGVVQLAKDQHEAAHRTLTEAARVTRQAYGDMDVRAARISSMLGRIAKKRCRYADAIEHYSAAWEVRDHLHGLMAEETVRLQLQIAEAQYLQGEIPEAIRTQVNVVEKLQQTGKLPVLLVDALAQLARWHENQNCDADALTVLQAAEKIVCDNLGPETSKAVEIKSDIALLHLKLGDHDTALQYLNDVHYYERCLHGSHSANVGKVLKALGTVHMVKGNTDAAEQSLYQALRIFEADYPLNNAIIRDLHAKLQRCHDQGPPPS